MAIHTETIKQVEKWSRITGLIKSTQARLKAADFAPVRRELEQTLQAQVIQLACNVVSDVKGKIPLVYCVDSSRHCCEYKVMAADAVIKLVVSTARRSRRAEWRGYDAPSENALYVSMHSDVSKLVFDIVKAID